MPPTDPSIAYRQILWNLPAWIEIFLYVGAILSTAILFYGMWRDIRRWRRGRPEPRWRNPLVRMRDMLQEIFGQKRVLRDPRPGVMHMLIFYGFVALFIGTDIIAAEEDITLGAFGEERGKLLVGPFYQWYELILDTMGLLFVVGLVWAAWRRYKQKLPRYDNRYTDAWVLGSMLFIGIGGFLIEGLRIANQCFPTQELCQAWVYDQDWARWSVVGYPLAVLFSAIGMGRGSGAGLFIHQWLWITHMVVVYAFIASIPYSKYRHIFYTPLNIFFQDSQPKGALDPIPNLEEEIEKDEPRLGITSLSDFSWKRRADFDACMRCGRCQTACPAWNSGTDLSPKYIITKMHDLMRGGPVYMRDGTVVVVNTPNGASPEAHEANEGEPAEGRVRHITGDVETLPLYESGLFTENELWSCTTCRACMTECPAMIEHVDDIVDLRRNLTMVQGEIPSGVKNVLQGIERSGNPWKLPQRDRTAWAEGLDVPTLAEKGEVEVLYWVGCAPSYDDRSKRVARSMVQLLQRAGVDFAILGDEETCTGDPARRMGEELLYEMQAKTNIETFSQYKFKKVITTCAHCFNTIKNEYPQFGGTAGVDYEVIHHTEYLAQLVAEGRLTPTERVEERVAYHDPCYIGRYNDIYDAPRNVLEAIPGLELVEAPEKNREKAMCCGGGGGNVWMEPWGKKPVNTIRLQQLQEANPTTIGIACPFCMIMFEDAAKNTGQGETLGRKDVAELLLASLPKQDKEAS
ncbi:MAG: hypothetical protein KatS3mg057_1237 [Herpetosiphonaceae bacterium]|nr:MAG: hypothetical protein KatS3mg057_1237 [Herpetosiphonaceae bacterium]